MSNMQGTTVSSSYAGFVDDTPPVLKAVFIQRIAKFACKTVERTIELAHVHTAWLDTMSNLRQAENIFKHNIPVDTAGAKPKPSYYYSKPPDPTPQQATWEKIKKLLFLSCERGHLWLAQALIASNIGFKEEMQTAEQKQKGILPRPILDVEWVHDDCLTMKLDHFPSALPSRPLKEGSSNHYIARKKGSVGVRLIALAIEHNRINVVASVIDPEIGGRRVLKDLISDRKQTPLHWACSLGRLEIVDLLLEHMKENEPGDLQALLTQEDYTGRQAVHYAADCPSVVEKLLDAVEGDEKKNPIVLGKGENVNLLHLACSVGNFETVKLLVEKFKFAVDKTIDGSMYSPLMIACAVKPESASSSSPSTSSSSSSSSSSSATAAASGEGEGGEGEEEGKKKKKQVVGGGNQPLEIAKFLLERGANVEAASQSGKRALHFAAKNANLELVSLLIGDTYKAERNCIDRAQNTPLHDCGNEAQIIDALLKDPKGKVDAKNKDGETALHLSARHGHFEAVKELIKNGATVDAVDKNRETPLYHAVKNHKMEAVRALIQARANPNLRNKSSESPLALAQKHAFESAAHAASSRAIFAILNDGHA